MAKEVEIYEGRPVFEATCWDELSRAEDEYIKDHGKNYDSLVVKVPEGTITIKDEAFSGYKNIGIVLLPETLTEIGDNAFYGCLALEHAVIPRSVTKIGYMAFADCIRLIEINIPENVRWIDNDAFDNCQSLSRIEVGSQNKIYDSRQGCNAIIKTDTNTLMKGCGSTVIPDSVTEIYYP